MNQKEIESMIEQKIAFAVHQQFQKNEERIGKAISRVESKIEFLTEKEIPQLLTQIFDNSEFMEGFKKQVLRFVEKEVNAQVKNFDVHNAVSGMVLDNIINILKDNLIRLVNEVIKGMNSNLQRELIHTKNLCYSIDAEIMHTLMKTPISYESEKKVMEKIEKTLQVMIENKNPESMKEISF